MKTLRINEVLFLEVFGRDVDFEDVYPQDIYLDLTTGDLVTVFESDEHADYEAGISEEENRGLKQAVATSPNDYLIIKGLTHGQHHDILKSFLQSSWSDNEENRRNAESAYFGSIGGWKEQVPDFVVNEYINFRDKKLKELAEHFLRDNGIEPKWI